MAGVYVHIPFCLKICGYCDFYRVAGTELVPPYIDSLLAEMEMRSDYLQGEAVDTIYFGGGTPSARGAGGEAESRGDDLRPRAARTAR